MQDPGRHLRPDSGRFGQRSGRGHGHSRPAEDAHHVRATVGRAAQSVGRAPQPGLPRPGQAQFLGAGRRHAPDLERGHCEGKRSQTGSATTSFELRAGLSARSRSFLGRRFPGRVEVRQFGQRLWPDLLPAGRQPCRRRFPRSPAENRPADKAIQGRRGAFGDLGGAFIINPTANQADRKYVEAVNNRWTGIKKPSRASHRLR